MPDEVDFEVEGSGRAGITGVSPIAAGLAGDITVTISGSGFDEKPDIYFGNSLVKDYVFESSKTLQAQLPAATQPGTVDITVVNSDGTVLTLEKGFTYVQTGQGDQVEVLKVSPLIVMEDTSTEFTIVGRNLVAAYKDGLVALRGPARANVSVSNVQDGRDAETGEDQLTMTVEITATPALQALERMIIQVLATRRPGAANDGVFESTKQLLVVLPKTTPALLAYSETLRTDKPNLVVVVGRNLTDCTLDLGQGTTVQMQNSDDRLLAAIVTVNEGETLPSESQLSVLSPAGGELAQFSMSVESSGGGDVPMEGPGGMQGPGGPEGPPEEAPPDPVDFHVTLATAPNQQLVAPTEADSVIFYLSGGPSTDFVFDPSNFRILVFDRTFTFPIIHEVHLISFFDQGKGSDPLSDVPVPAEVGRLLRLRGVGILVAFHFDFTIRIQVWIIVGFFFEVWPFGLYNEFPEYAFGIGSFLIGVEVEITIHLIFAFLVAAVLPEGRLRVLQSDIVTINLTFTFGTEGNHLSFGSTYAFDYFRIGPLLGNLLPCNGQFQLAAENGQTVFTDTFGGQQSFYFPRAAGECCVPWNFDLRMRLITDGGPGQTVQGAYDASYCLNAAPAARLGKIVITSNPPATGFPETLVMDLAETAILTALFVPVDPNGNPTGEPPQDVRDVGYDVEFILESPTQVVLDPGSLRAGSAFSIQDGHNVIQALLAPKVNEPQFFNFWPGSVLGFSLVSRLLENREGAILAGSLPVTVNPPPNPVKVQLSIAYFTNPSDPNTLTAVAAPFQVTPVSGQPSQSVWEVDRFEPFETQRPYYLAVKLTEVPPAVTLPIDITFTVSTVRMLVRENGTLSAAAPMVPVGSLPRAQVPPDPSKFFAGRLSTQTQQVTVRVTTANKLTAVIDTNPNPDVGLDLLPNVKENATAGTYVPPGQLVGNRDPDLAPTNNRDILFSVAVTAASSGNTLNVENSTVYAVVVNGETFEEYLRVFAEAQSLLSPVNAAVTPYRDFPASFMASLAGANGLGDNLRTKGVALWQHAYMTVQSTTAANALKDDRQLYYARLLSICALRAHCKRNNVSGVAGLIAKFEWPSRGLDQMTGNIDLTDIPPRTRRGIITGFDPFELTSTPDKANPSGLAALYFHRKTFGPANAPVAFRAAVVPVRYKEFDEGLIANAVKDNVRSLIMLMTTSENGPRDFYDIERWAGKNRLKLIDNNNVIPPGPVLIDIIPGDPQFLESTLPYERVITSRQTLPGPKGFTTPPEHETLFVIDQSYRVVETTVPPTVQKDGENRPSPGEDNSDGFTKRPDKPNLALTSDYGSGSNYLSNEIFYRTARERNKVWRSLPSGHFHLPGFLRLSPPNATNATLERQQRERLVNGVESALQRLVERLPRLRVHDLNFPQRAVNTTSAPIVMTASNDTNEAIIVGAIDVPPPFAFTQANQLPITVGAGAEVSLPFTFTPTAAATSYEVLVSLLAPPPTPSPTPGPDEVAWVDDRFPTGSTFSGDGDGWNWIGAGPVAPFSGSGAHYSSAVRGQHEHYFQGATATLAVGTGDKLFTYVYLDPVNPPTEIMLQWNDGTWEHRAYWGTNSINLGTNNTPSRWFGGGLPAPGQWARLDISAAAIGLEGQTVNGMAFTLANGRAVFDRAGKIPAASAGAETIWQDEALPSGAVEGGINEEWRWTSAAPKPFFGFAAHQSTPFISGLHQHHFTGANPGLAVNTGDSLFCHVYLDPVNMPAEVMLQWFDGTWEHRAYWGQNRLDLGVDGTNSRRYRGPLPAANQWVRLEVPASLLGLEGSTLTGMAFTLWDGRVTWDRAGKKSQPNFGAETVWVEDALPAGATPGGNEPWTWTPPCPGPVSGTGAYQSNLAAGMHQHQFVGATQTLEVGQGDKLFAYVFLDPTNVPTEVMLQWNDGTWEHRAYWGANEINLGTNGTNSRRFIGPLPPAGQWVRLEVLSSRVGLEGKTINGMAFTLFGGRATWDRSGKIPGGASDQVLVTATLTGQST